MVTLAKAHDFENRSGGSVGGDYFEGQLLGGYGLGQVNHGQGLMIVRDFMQHRAVTIAEAEVAHAKRHDVFGVAHENGFQRMIPIGIEGDAYFVNRLGLCPREGECR